jgi:hypothetical protein
MLFKYQTNIQFYWHKSLLFYTKMRLNPTNYYQFKKKLKEVEKY